MGVAEKFVMGVVVIALATTLILPDRQTDKILGTIFKGGTEALKTSMGR